MPLVFCVYTLHAYFGTDDQLARRHGFQNLDTDATARVERYYQDVLVGSKSLCVRDFSFAEDAGREVLIERLRHIATCKVEGDLRRDGMKAGPYFGQEPGN